MRKPSSSSSKASKGKILFLVESPSKAKVIQKYLGDAYRVAASLGHVRDLPKKSPFRKGKAKTQNVRSLSPDERLVLAMSIDPFHGWKASYEVPLDKVKLVKELKALAEGADQIILATDPDREGEAIAWHLQESLGGSAEKYRRITFNSVTQKAILKAMESAGSVNLDFVRAQQARRFLDRLVGFMVSPVLWQKVVPGISAGRVQTPALALIVEKEGEIQSFIPQAYREIFAQLALPSQTEGFEFKLAKVDGKGFKGFDLQGSEEIFQALRPCVDWRVSAADLKKVDVEPHPPFMTSTLQQVASQKFKWSVKRVMQVAQRLYDQGFITYMRTDSVQVAPETMASLEAWIRSHHPAEFHPPQRRHFQKRAQAQEAHEAIHPTQLSRSFESVTRQLGAPEAKLYQLIFERFVASQMSAATVLQGKFQVTALDGRCIFEYLGKRVCFEGWMQVHPDGLRGMEKPLPQWKMNEALSVLDLKTLEKKTQPPSRYSESKLVKELERRGIGRPSTYAPILETIQARQYVTLKQGYFYATRLGMLVARRLTQHFTEFFSYAFTSEMESRLDEIAQAKLLWTAVLDQFFETLRPQVEEAKRPESEGGMSKVADQTLKSLSCSSCKQPMSFVLGRFGPFLKCSQALENPKDPEACSGKTTFKMIPYSEWTAEMLAPIEGELIPFEDRLCALCGLTLEPYAMADMASILYLCNAAPDCGGHVIQPISKPVWMQEEVLETACLSCKEGHYTKKTGRFGPYVVCNHCGEKRKWEEGSVSKRANQAIPFPEIRSERHPDAFFILREGKTGLFFASNLFPKVRECRSPAVFELKAARERLPEIWHIWADGPLEDEAGHPTYLRFDRKANLPYIGSKSKTTGKWTSFFYDPREPSSKA